MVSECVVIIFTKSPVPGQVKTRLIPYMGETDAAELYKSLIKRTLTTAKASSVNSIQLWSTPDVIHPYLVSCASEYEVELHLQQGRDLGERMYFALDSALHQYDCAVLIGSDCFNLTANDIDTAFHKLKKTYQAVLGPAQDGGYYLIGIRSLYKELFERINWGSDEVLTETRERLNNLGLEWYELTERWDLDRPEDLQRYNLLMESYIK